jgi:hypothetical protein
MKRALCICLLLPAFPTWAVTGSFRPVSNTFVLSPGPASPLPDANNLNFGGSGSLCVSSSGARAYDPNEGIDHLPKGEFITLLKFDPSLCKGTTLSTMTLKLAITNGNQSANGIFNYLGSPGSFDLFWVSSDWKQGYGTPTVMAGPSVGITYTELAALLSRSAPAYLETLCYDARHPYSAGENWFAFELDLKDPNYAGLVGAIEEGQTVTFMLHAPADRGACFNIRAYVQYSKNGAYTVRETGPFLEVEIALPAVAFDFDGSGMIDLADLDYLIDHWKETGPDLAADIAPLGGDGLVDILDLTEFLEYWSEHGTESVAIQ